MSKRPLSVLVVIHTPRLEILLLERASHPGYWQSVTGSSEGTESLTETATREVAEETGLDTRQFSLRSWNVTNRFEIFAEWRHRYAAGVTENVEHVFSLAVPERLPIRVASDEHLAYAWVPWQLAADRVFSWTNRDAIVSIGIEHDAALHATAS